MSRTITPPVIRVTATVGVRVVKATAKIKNPPIPVDRPFQTDLALLYSVSKL